MPKDYHWLLTHLCGTDKVKGCEMVYPDTAFFVKGKPKGIVRMDKEWCLVLVKGGNRVNLQNIYKEFSNVVRERKKEWMGPFQKMMIGRKSGGNMDLFGLFPSGNQLEPSFSTRVKEATSPKSP